MRAVANSFTRGLRLASRTGNHGHQNPTEDAAGVRSMSRGTERGAIQNATQGAVFENSGGEELTREETKTAYDEGSAEFARAVVCHREMVNKDSVDATVAEKGTQGAPQPLSSGVDEGQHTGRRILLVENQNTAEEANALG